MEEAVKSAAPPPTQTETGLTTEGGFEPGKTDITTGVAGVSQVGVKSSVTYTVNTFPTVFNLGSFAGVKDTELPVALVNKVVRPALEYILYVGLPEAHL
ncbi:MAG: hypothetical protein IPF63_08980 [Bacteroidetes bacterium]|nr:hypothetical protein [Bacteroidota bacterium]